MSLSKRLPSPLSDKIAPFIAKIPTAETSTVAPLPNRLQNVVAIMTLVDEFNNDLHLTHTIKELDNGEVIDVRVLYWGLGAAYAINGSGDRAWTLKPSDEAWLWNAADQDAIAIKKLFDVYDKTLEPTLVGLPIQLAGKEIAP